MASPAPRNLKGSTIAVATGIVVIVVLSLLTDQFFHFVHLYPPWGQPMPATGHNLLALAYRTAFSILGAFVTARLAPRHPLRHAMVGGAIGVVLGTVGAIATIPMELGPAWYPIALPVEALPCAYLGGLLGGRLRQGRTGTAQE